MNAPSEQNLFVCRGLTVAWNPPRGETKAFLCPSPQSRTWHKSRCSVCMCGWIRAEMTIPDRKTRPCKGLRVGNRWCIWGTGGHSGDTEIICGPGHEQEMSMEKEAVKKPDGYERLWTLSQGQCGLQKNLSREVRLSDPYYSRYGVRNVWEGRSLEVGNGLGVCV